MIRGYGSRRGRTTAGGTLSGTAARIIRPVSIAESE